MFNISKFLGKFSKEVDSLEANKQKVSEIIKNVTGLNIEVGDIEIKNYIVYIKSNPSILNKIFISKVRLIESISNSTNIKIIDIK